MSCGSKSRTSSRSSPGAATRRASSSRTSPTSSSRGDTCAGSSSSAAASKSARLRARRSLDSVDRRGETVSRAEEINHHRFEVPLAHARHGVLPDSRA